MRWSNIEDNVILRLYSNLGPQGIMDSGEIDRSYEAIKCRARKFDLVFRKRYSCNEDYFNNPTIKSCYWAGLIAADGNIYYQDKRRLPVLKLSLKKSDEDHIIKFRNQIGYDGPITSHIQTQDDKIFEQSTIRISSLKLCDDLKKNFNIVRRKSLSLKSPTGLNAEQSASFIVGYIDGDGYIGRVNSYLRCTILGTYEMLNWIAKTIDKLTDLDTGASITKKGKIHYYTVSGEYAEVVLSKLKSIDVHHLCRKWNNI